YFYDNVFKNYNLERGVIRGDGEQAKEHLDDAHFKAKMVGQEAEKAKAARDAALQETVKLREHINKLESIETKLADRDSMNVLNKEYNDIVKTIKSVGDRVAEGNLELKKPAFSKNKNEVSLGSVQRASWELADYFKKVEPVMNRVQKLEQNLSDMKDREQQLIEERAREIVRQTQEQLQRDLQKAEKDRKSAYEAKKKYEELKTEQESYILGTSENKAQVIFNNFINKEFRQELEGRGARLEQFADSLTMKNGRSVLDAFNEREQERQAKLTREYERTIRETMRQAERFEDMQIEDYEDFER
nr:hypothetical protein [Bacteroidaceae bacterium]